MTVSYVGRLVCLSLAFYFLAHAALALGIRAAGGWAIRVAERLRPRDGARLLLALRLLPAALTCMAVAGLCIPSFLWLEPSETGEQAGVLCVGAAVLGAAIWVRALCRASKAVLQSRRFAAICEQTARANEPASQQSWWIVDTGAPALALVGLVRPRVVVSRELIESMTAEQLRAALQHENAHGRSRDNWKRLALVLAPEILPGWRAFGALERAWARLAEWSADETAAGAGPRERLVLAEALLRAARLGGARAAAGPLVTAFVEEPLDLEVRVKRLLDAPAGVVPARRYWAAAGLWGGCLGILLLRPEALLCVHQLLERLMR